MIFPKITFLLYIHYKKYYQNIFLNSYSKSNQFNFNFSAVNN